MFPVPPACWYSDAMAPCAAGEEKRITKVAAAIVPLQMFAVGVAPTGLPLPSSRYWLSALLKLTALLLDELIELPTFSVGVTPSVGIGLPSGRHHHPTALPDESVSCGEPTGSL